MIKKFLLSVLVILALQNSTEAISIGDYKANCINDRANESTRMVCSMSEFAMLDGYLYGYLNGGGDSLSNPSSSYRFCYAKVKAETKNQKKERFISFMKFASKGDLDKKTRETDVESIIAVFFSSNYPLSDCKE